MMSSKAAFIKLPAQFAFKQAKQTYGRSDDPTRDWLLKCVGAGLIRQTGRGLKASVENLEKLNNFIPGAAILSLSRLGISN